MSVHSGATIQRGAAFQKETEKVQNEDILDASAAEEKGAKSSGI